MAGSTWTTGLSTCSSISLAALGETPWWAAATLIFFTLFLHYAWQLAQRPDLANQWLEILERWRRRGP
jgi:hypothetical protein